MRHLMFAAVLATACVTPGVAVEPAPTIVMNGYVHDFNPGVAIGGETDPAGWVLSPQARNREISLPRLVYLEGPDGPINLRPYAGASVEVTGVVERGALNAGGVETPARAFDVLRIETIQAAGKGGVARAKIVADLENRGVNVFRDGTPEPAGDLSVDGVCGDADPALRVAIDVPVTNSADMFTTTAFLCGDCGCYWVHQQGGFAGVNLWVGPFATPDVERDGAPTRVRPSRLQAPRRTRKRTITVYRGLTVPASRSVRVSKKDYDPADFDLGPGIDVIKVLRATKRRIRLRVAVQPDLDAGSRDVSFRDRVGPALLTVRSRR